MKGILAVENHELHVDCLFFSGALNRDVGEESSSGTDALANQFTSAVENSAERRRAHFFPLEIFDDNSYESRTPIEWVQVSTMGVDLFLPG